MSATRYCVGRLSFSRFRETGPTLLFRTAPTGSGRSDVQGQSKKQPQAAALIRIVDAPLGPSALRTTQTRARRRDLATHPCRYFARLCTSRTAHPRTPTHLAIHLPDYVGVYVRRLCTADPTHDQVVWQVYGKMNGVDDASRTTVRSARNPAKAGRGVRASTTTSRSHHDGSAINGISPTRCWRDLACSVSVSGVPEISSRVPTAPAPANRGCPSTRETLPLRGSNAVQASKARRTVECALISTVWIVVGLIDQRRATCPGSERVGNRPSFADFERLIPTAPAVCPVGSRQPATVVPRS